MSLEPVESLRRLESVWQWLHQKDSFLNGVGKPRVNVFTMPFIAFAQAVAACMCRWLVIICMFLDGSFASIIWHWSPALPARKRPSRHLLSHAFAACTARSFGVVHNLSLPLFLHAAGVCLSFFSSWAMRLLQLCPSLHAADVCLSLLVLGAAALSLLLACKRIRSTSCFVDCHVVPCYEWLHSFDLLRDANCGSLSIPSVRCIVVSLKLCCWMLFLHLLHCLPCRHDLFVPSCCSILSLSLADACIGPYWHDCSSHRCCSKKRARWARRRLAAPRKRMSVTEKFYDCDMFTDARVFQCHGAPVSMRAVKPISADGNCFWHAIFGKAWRRKKAEMLAVAPVDVRAPLLARRRWISTPGVLHVVESLHRPVILYQPCGQSCVPALSHP